MIEHVDERLRVWIKTVLDGVEVSFAPPTRSPTGQGVNVYLIELIHDPPARGKNGPPLQLMLRYLVSTWSPDWSEAHRLLSTLVFAAMENSKDFEVELSPVPAEVWTAFGVGPLPSFFLRMPVRRERPERVAPLVRQAPIIHHSPICSLDGVVYGPGKTPVMAVRVDWPALNLSTGTDYNGRFHFPAVPSDVPIKLRLQVKGRNLEVTKDPAGRLQEPLIIALEEL